MTNILYITKKVKYSLHFLEHLYHKDNLYHFIIKYNFYLS